MRDTLVRETGPEPQAAVIWLHGLGASADDFVPVIPHLNLAGCGDIRFLFPQAPSRPVTINQGMVMPAWYDILSLGLEREVDSEHLLASAQTIGQMIEQQVAQGIDSRRIVLIGFSQGGAVAYQTALSHPQPLAGLLALSTYLATADSLTLSDANRQLPVEIHHGSQDPMVPPQLAHKAAERLTQMGLAPRTRSYAMAHELCMAQLDDISSFLRQVLG
ncbi:alpha/beta hydrolase [Ferrimonas marina]|uniref:Phospholipase/carboxylesterase n=1 Tax=Ferrimonas marina TaxID=299255 RepID=A0A1M5NKJ7_9GAMM|nr:alpha/beta fold hydrolase [Ferrimonas marina]SHG90134.1 phospholipase/carboxylesterase [Ferrimonas marina]